MVSIGQMSSLSLALLVAAPVLAGEPLFVYTLARQGASLDMAMQVEEALRGLASAEGSAPLDPSEAETRLFGHQGANGACGAREDCIRDVGRALGVKVMIFGTVTSTGKEVWARLSRLEVSGGPAVHVQARALPAEPFALEAALSGTVGPLFRPPAAPVVVAKAAPPAPPPPAPVPELPVMLPPMPIAAPAPAAAPAPPGREAPPPLVMAVAPPADAPVEAPARVIVASDPSAAPAPTGPLAPAPAPVQPNPMLVYAGAGVAGVGVIAFIVGSVLGASAGSDREALEAQLQAYPGGLIPNVDSDKRDIRGRLDDIHSGAVWANVLMIGGGILAGTGGAVVALELGGSGAMFKLRSEF